MVEPQPSKLIMRVRFPSPAPYEVTRFDTIALVKIKWTRIRPFF